MNCNYRSKIVVNNLPTREEIIESMSRETVEQFKTEVRNQTIRRMLKVMCIMLNERHGHGAGRLPGDIQHIADIFAEEAAKDEEFWWHCDQRLEQLKVSDIFTPEEIALKMKNQPML